MAKKSKIPEWMVRKVQIQGQLRSNKLAMSRPGNQIVIIRKWGSNLSSWAKQVNTTVEKLVAAAGYQNYQFYLPPPMGHGASWRGR